MQNDPNGQGPSQEVPIDPLTPQGVPQEQPNSAPQGQPYEQPSAYAPTSFGQPTSEIPAPVEQSIPPAVPVQPVVPQTPVDPIAAGPTPEGQSEFPPKKKKKGLVVGLIIAAVVVLLGGGSVAAYNLWYQNPDKVVGDALVNTLTARSLNLDGTMNFEQDGAAVKVTLNGKAKENAAEFDATLDYKKDDQSFNVKGAGMMSSEGDLYIKVDDARKLIDSYFDSAAQMETPKAFDDIIKKIDGNWIKISKDDLGTVNEEAEKTRVCYQDLASTLGQNRAWSNELVDLYKKNKFILVEEKLGAKDVDGTGSLGYRLGFSKDAASAFATGIADTQFGKKLKECDATIDFKNLANSITDTKEAKDGRLELWVSRFGHEPTELTFTAPDDNGNGEIVVRPEINKDVTVAAPANSVSLSDLKADYEAAINAYTAEIMQSYGY